MGDYPGWLDGFGFPDDIDKGNLSNMCKALLWAIGQSGGSPPAPAGNSVVVLQSKGNLPATGAANVLYAVYDTQESFVWKGGAYRKVGEADVLLDWRGE